MTVLYAALLGIIQGLTEFLPVSSSAHLILARVLFGWDADQLGLAFDVACHVGTLAAVLAYFRVELIALAAATPRILTGGEDAPARLGRLIVIGTLPIVVVGLSFGDYIEDHLRTPGIACAMLAVGAIALLLAERFGARVRDETSVTAWEAVAIGLAQASALVPGVSRSGATIAVGMLLGLRRDSIARFSFLLGVPAIVAAAAKEAVVLRHETLMPETQLIFAVGAITSAVVGYLTVKYFIRYVGGHSLKSFAFYRLALAVSIPLWLALSR